MSFGPPFHGAMEANDSSAQVKEAYGSRFKTPDEKSTGSRRPSSYILDKIARECHPMHGEVGEPVPRGNPT